MLFKYIFMLILSSLEVWYVQGFVLLTGFLPNSEIALDSVSIWYVFEKIILVSGIEHLINHIIYYI